MEPCLEATHLLWAVMAEQINILAFLTDSQALSTVVAIFGLLSALLVRVCMCTISGRLKVVYRRLTLERCNYVSMPAPFSSWLQPFPQINNSSQKPARMQPTSAQSD